MPEFVQRLAEALIRDGVKLAIVLVGLSLFVGIGETLHRWGLAPSVSRRVVHMGVGLVVAVTPLVFYGPAPLYLLAVLFIGVNALAWQRGQWAGLHAARPKSVGTITFPLALLPALALTWSIAADRRFALQVAFLVLAVADPLAAWAGMRFGPMRKGRRTGKTGMGSLAFALGALLVTGLTLLAWRATGALAWTLPQVMGMSLVVAVVTTGAEALGRRGWDNFWIVLAAVVPLVAVHERPAVWTAMLLGVGAGIGFALAAWRMRLLSPSGAIAGGLLAASLIGLGGWAWIVPGLAFFLLSSGLSRIGSAQKRAASARSEKGAVRDAGQVYANGGVAWALLVLHAVLPAASPLPEAGWYLAFLGAFATAAADTWATEIGALAPGRPRLVTTGRRVPVGTSGAVSGLGTLAAALGAASVAVSAWLVTPDAFGLARVGLVVGSGVAGALVDSLLGATLQAQYAVPGDGELTERPGGRRVRGYRWMTNDRVNALATAAGAATAWSGFWLMV